jgi:hypothetical protein
MPRLQEYYFVLQNTLCSVAQSRMMYAANGICIPKKNEDGCGVVVDTGGLAQTDASPPIQNNNDILPALLSNTHLTPNACIQRRRLDRTLCSCSVDRRIAQGGSQLIV